MVERPVAVYSTMIGGYQFTPWFPFSDQKRYSIDKHNIIGDSSVVDEIKTEYIKYALAKKEPLPLPETMESIIERMTDQIATKFEIEDEYDEYEPPIQSKETIH